MPTYAYACKDCDHAFDIHQAFSDDSLTVCPECSGALRKKFNSVGVVFKGSGFYRNDSRDTQKSVDPGTGTGASKPAGESSSGSSADTSAASTGSSATKNTTAAPATPAPAKTAAAS